MPNSTFLTLDIDWAPDFVIDWVADQLIAKQVKATWFVTHSSPAVDRLRERADLFELGIHPNFLPNSTQGTTVEDVLKFCLQIVPDAVSMRTHSLFQSSPLLAKIMTTTPIWVDTSLFLPYIPHLQPVEYYVNKQLLIRFPYFWEDDFEMERPTPDWQLKRSITTESGLKIFNFHPIHIYLNSASMTPYYALKSEIAQLLDAAPDQVDRHIFNGLGTQTSFSVLVAYLSSVGKSATLVEFANQQFPMGRNAVL